MERLRQAILAIGYEDMDMIGELTRQTRELVRAFNDYAPASEAITEWEAQ